MKSHHSVFVLVSFSALLLQACDAAESQSDIIATNVAQTMQISQLETAAAGASSVTETVQISATEAPTLSVETPTSTPETPSSTPEEIAPDPLPASHTGVILNNGECFNFDNGLVTAPDSQCDVWLAESALFRQVNAAQISGYVTLTPPTQSQCVAGRYETGDLAVMTDMYMCFITNEGGVGFIVVRQYVGTVPFTGVVFDYWLFN